MRSIARYHSLPFRIGLAFAVAIATASSHAATSAYSTSFDVDENPISEDGRWFNETGTSSVVRTIGGNAFGTHEGVAYDDSIAHLRGFPPDQFIEGTVYKTGSFAFNQEIQLLLRMTTSSNYVRGYEILMNTGTSAQIMRWDGTFPGNFFTEIGSVSLGGALQSGDTIRAQIVGSTITVFKNGVQLGTVVDSSIASGDPGIAFFTRDVSGEQNTRFGWAAISAGATGDGARVPSPPTNLSVH